MLIRAPFRITFSYAGPDQVWQPTWRDQMQLARQDPHRGARRRYRTGAERLQRGHRSRQCAGRMRAGEKRLGMPERMAEPDARNRMRKRRRSSSDGLNRAWALSIQINRLDRQRRARLYRRRRAVDSGRSVGAGPDLSDLRHQHRRSWWPVSTDRVQIEALVSAGVELAAYRLASVNEAAPPDQRNLQCHGRRWPGVRDVPLRGRAHRPQCGAERSCLPADRRARHQRSQRGKLCRSDPGLAHGDGSRRRRSREFVLSHHGHRPMCRAMRLFRRSRNCGWCAGFRRWSSRRCFPS